MYKTAKHLLLSAILVIPITGVSQSISITGITPDSPSLLNFGEEVNVSFEYTAGNRRGVRIFVRPVSNGSITPNYAASGSPVYKRRGRGRAHFTIRKGKATVDQLRFRVMSANQNRMLFEFFVPVEFTFSSAPFVMDGYDISKNLKVVPLDKLEKFYKPKDDTADIPQFGSIPEDAEVTERVIEEDGTIRIFYTGGYVRVVEPSEREYILTPEGDTLLIPVPMINVQPASPPAFVASDGSEANREWLIMLHEWLEYHGRRLLNRIQMMLNNEESFQKYREFEESHSSTVYEKINLRYRFLTDLMTADR